MASKKKNFVSVAERPGHARSEREAELEKEYSALTEKLNTLKTRAEQLRRDNEFLSNEASQTRMESQEFMSYVSKQTEKLQSKTVTLSDQRQQELQEMRRQTVETQKKYEEQTKQLKKEILEKEKELVLLNVEMSELRELKSLQQQQLGRITELEQEVAATLCLYSESLQDLKSDFLMKKKNYETQTKHKVQILTLTAEASLHLLTYMQEMYQENQCLCTELLQLIQRAHALRSHQVMLQSQYRQLL